MDSLSLLSGSIHNPGWRFCHLLSLLPRASIINRWLVEVSGAASVGEKQVEARGSSYHSEKNTDRLSKAETAEKSGRDAEFRVAGRRSEVNKQRIKGNWKWQQQEWKGGMWGTEEEVGVASVQRHFVCYSCSLQICANMSHAGSRNMFPSQDGVFWWKWALASLLLRTKVMLLSFCEDTVMAQTFSMTQQMCLQKASSLVMFGGWGIKELTQS